MSTAFESARQETRPGAHAIRELALGPLFAAQFLTVLPPLVRRQPTRRELGAAEAFFPAAGLLVGACLILLDLGFVVLPPMVRSVAVVAAAAALTGALHLDGIVDTFDGLFGAHDRDSKLAVMRDPRAGTYGVIAVVCTLLLQVSAVHAMSDQLRAPALLMAPCLGRWAIVAVTWTYPYARPQGMGRAFKDSMTLLGVIIAGCTALAAAYLLWGGMGVGLFAASSAAALATGWLVCRHLGGLTGDVYGAVCELVTTFALIWMASAG
ncbi:MAG: adenosylcobinamide-GDP ribazoletransferase [Chloroflexota bacterium]